MSFQYHGNLNGGAQPVMRKIVIRASQTIAVGDSFKTFSNGYAERSSSGKALRGVVQGIVTKEGDPVTTDGSGDTYTGSYTAASTNATTEQISVLGIIDRDAIFSASVTGTLNTTLATGNLIGCEYDATYSSLTETSATRSGTGQWYSWGADPEDSTRLLVSMNEVENAGTSASF